MIKQQIKFIGSTLECCVDSIINIDPEITIRKISDNLQHVTFTYQIDEVAKQDDWKVILNPDFIPTFHWAPHLTPTKNHVIDQHVFRSPALIISNPKRVVMVIPDLEIISSSYNTPEAHTDTKKPHWYLDLDAQNNHLILGMSRTRLNDHVLFIKGKGARYPPGLTKYGFYIMYFEESEIVKNPWRKILEFLWSRWGEKLYKQGKPLHPDLTQYVETTYDWAFNRWKNQVWQEFSIEGKKVGAPVLIVSATQSPNNKRPFNEREFQSIWNQAWFSSLRSASGLYRYAIRTNNKENLEKARLTKELALSFPQKEGIFPSVIGTELETKEINGKIAACSKSWEHYFWGNSDKNPFTDDPRVSPYHILDMSYTALNMLRWYEELEQDGRLLEYAEKYAEALLKLQAHDGFFPAWLEFKTLKPMGILEKSPESSMSITFLLKLFKLTKNEKYRESALKAMDSIIRIIILKGQWEDFETYWSCCQFGSDRVGKKIPRNNMFKQCNFSMFWTAEALLECYYSTLNKKFLEIGQRVLDELLMTQASWQPPYIYVDSLGGFGVMNADGEWNDARQSLFSELIVKYGLELKCKEYIQRGLAALRASFVIMYCPQNPQVKVQWEKTWLFFNEKDYGFMMENYGHVGKTRPDGRGMGGFTIYDWGNGSASEAFNRMVDHYGLEFLIQN